MIYLWATLLVLSNLVWLFLTLLTLPGNWMMVGVTAAVAWWQWDEGMFSPWTLVAILALAVLGEVLEFLAAAVGVRGAGGSKWGGIGALVGGLIGAGYGTVLVPVPLAGTLVGACLGACLGGWAGEVAGGRGARPSVKLGLAAGVGRFLGAVAKFAVGVVIWAIIAVAAFWP